MHQPYTNTEEVFRELALELRLTCTHEEDKLIEEARKLLKRSRESLRRVS